MNDDESGQDEKVAVLRAAIDEAIAELDAGDGEEMTVEALMAEVRHAAGLVEDADRTS